MESLEEVFKPTWYINKFKSFDDARSFAIDHGWRANNQLVQVRWENGWYLIEPFEKNCNCSNIIPPF